MTDRTYSDAEIAERLTGVLRHWYLEDDFIRRKYRTGGWKSTLMAVNAVGHLASFPWVEVRLRNHDANGITDKDFELAAKIEDVLQWQPGSEPGSLTGTPQNDPRFSHIKYD